MNESRYDTAAVVGAGTIGLAWAALFSAHGMRVRLNDPRADLERSLREAMPTLAESLPGGGTADDLLSRIEVVPELSEAVRDADLVQENGPERLEFKQRLFAEIARAAPRDAVLATSSSGIVASDIAAELSDDVAARLLVVHPFNPPQVVPLVEIVPGNRTAERVTTDALELYRRLGKTPVRLHAETCGFVANRLQSAVMQESISLVLRGVVSIEELDTVMKSSLGNRWATVGPFESFHLGGGPGGIRHMIEHLGRGMAQRWSDLGRPELNGDNVEVIADQTEHAYGTGAESYRARSEARDRKQLALTEAIRRAADRP